MTITAGSSGGGRGSAARTLSKYGGFAIKISTDVMSKFSLTLQGFMR